MDVTTILQFNCQGSYAVVCELGQAMRRLGARFALLQEPYTSDGRVDGLPGGMRVFTDAIGDSAIVVDGSNINCTVVSSGPFGVCISAEGDFGRILLASVYCRYSANLEPYLGYMDTLLLHASSNPLILGLDANACSPAWFSKMARVIPGHPNHARGIVLSEWLVTKGVSVLNEASDLYTFDGPNGASDIDVTVVNDAAITELTFRWTVRDVWGVSDHNLIEIGVTYSTRVGTALPSRRWRLNGANWGHYEELIRAQSSVQSMDYLREIPVDDVAVRIDSWMCTVNDELLGRCRETRPSKVKWWTRELDLERRRVRRLRKRFQRARHDDAPDLAQRRADFLAAQRTYKNLILRVKEDDWRQFVSENSDDPWGKVYRICRGKNRRTDIAGLQVDGVTLSTWGRCADVLLGAFFPEAEPAVHSPPLEEVVAAPALETRELIDSIGRIKSRKSPGIDGMTGKMCKSIWKAIPECLEMVFGRCLSEGYFPRAWKIARVVVLLKSPDRVVSDPRSYRGISLLPVLGKVLERIMVTRLREVYNEGNSEYQFGFREGRSVEDAWLHVKRCVADSASRYVLGIFVDFKGAFDYLSWGRVLERLREVGCRELSLWRSYFDDRRACIDGAGDAVWRNVTRGCPQGSICGPYIWNLMMDPLLRRLGRTVKLCAYADDLLILVEGQTRSDLEDLGRWAIHEVNEWGDRVGVQVALDKTSTMLLKGKLSAERPPLIRTGATRLRYVTQVKYLGIMVGERMNFMVHFPYIKDKLAAVVGKVRRVLRTDWGLSRRATRAIYGGLFVACATFGAPVWYETVMSVVGRNKILSCQRMAMLACMPVCRTVSTDALQVLLGAAPLDLEAIRLGIAYKIKRGLPLLDRDWVSARDVSDGWCRRSKALLRECLVTRWSDRWTNCHKGRVTYGFIRDVTFVLERPDFGFGLSLGFLLTGHGSLNAFLHERGLSSTADCSCGSGTENWEHVLTECSLYANFRDLDGMGITRTGAGWDYSRSLYDDRIRIESIEGIRPSGV